jgi:ABC-type multidrug transport system ATPase subunit
VSIWVEHQGLIIHDKEGTVVSSNHKTPEASMPIPGSPEETSPSSTPRPIFGGALLEAREVSLQTRRGDVLAKDISIFIRPGEMVVLTGPEGASLTAVLQSLAGLFPLKGGQVIVDQANLAANFKALRPRIGYVPREDTLPEGDTVREALMDAARMHLPRETSGDARRHLIAQVLSDLDLREVEAMRLERLTEAQRRHVNVAVQVVKSPSYLLVDESATGSDAYSDAKLAGNLRRLAKKGLTVVIVSRSPSAARLADKVAVLAAGGFLAWYGPPDDALAYFREQIPGSEVATERLTFDAILPNLEKNSQKKSDGKEWGSRFQAHPAYEQNSLNPLSSKRPDLLLQDRPLSRLRGTDGEPQPPRPVRQASAVSQFFTLAGRSWRELVRTRAGLLALVAPILAGLVDMLISSPQMLDPLAGDPWRAATASGLLVFFALLMPAAIFSLFLHRDRAVFRRDRRQNLSVIAYLLSKVWVVGLYAAYLSLVLTAVHSVASGLAGGIFSLPVYWITLFLLSMTGGLLGLLASSITGSPLAAIGIALLLIVPQVFLGGVFAPVTETNPASRILSMLMPARHGFEAVLTASGFGQDLINDPCWRLSPQELAGLTEAQKAVCPCQGINIFSQCTFPGVYQSFTPAIEQTEPALPTLGAEVRLPVQPILRQGITLEQYAQEINDYTLALESYQGTLDRFISNLRQYAQDLSTWQGSRSLAVGRAEGQLALANERFGPFLGVSLAANWITLIGFTLLFFILLVVAQKRKGVV